MNTTDIQELCRSASGQYGVDENSNRIVVILPLTGDLNRYEEFHDLRGVFGGHEDTICPAGLKKHIL